MSPEPAERKKRGRDRKGLRRVTTAELMGRIDACWRLLDAGLSDGEIKRVLTVRFEVEPRTIGEYLARARKYIREEAGRPVEEQRADERSRLYRVIAEAWQAYERSRRDSEEVIEDIGPAGKATVVRRKRRGQAGGTQYLNTIVKASERLAKLIGLDAPVKIAPTTPDGTEPYRPDFGRLSDEDLATLDQLLSQAAGDVIEGEVRQIAGLEDNGEET